MDQVVTKERLIPRPIFHQHFSYGRFTRTQIARLYDAEECATRFHGSCEVKIEKHDAAKGTTEDIQLRCQACLAIG